MVTSKRDDLEDLQLWVEIQKQVAILRESVGNEMPTGKEAAGTKLAVLTN